MKLEEKIYLIRKKQGLSQEEFADKLGVSRQAVYKWETGTTSPEIEKIKTIAKLFSVSFDYLMNDDIIEMDNYKVAPTQEKNTYIIRPNFFSNKKLHYDQVDIDNGYLPNRKSKLKSIWLSTRQSKTKKHLSTIGASNVIFVPNCSATAFFYDLKKKVIGFYYAGEVQFVCPFENIVKFTYKHDSPLTVNTRTPVVGVGFNSSGINSFGVGSIPHQRTFNTTSALASLTYKTEKNETKTYDIDFSISCRYHLQECDNEEQVQVFQHGQFLDLLRTLDKIDAKITEFIEEGKGIVAGEICPEDFDVSLYVKKNKEFKKEYDTFLYLANKETKKDNIIGLVKSILFWGFVAGLIIVIIWSTLLI